MFPAGRPTCRTASGFTSISVGLLRARFRPPSFICAIRSLWRHSSLIQIAAEHVLHMQKALDHMNLQILRVLNDISGMSSLRILDAILAGERDPYQLFLACCELVSAERSPELVPRMCRLALMINQNHNVQTRLRTRFNQCLLSNPSSQRRFWWTMMPWRNLARQVIFVRAEEIVKVGFLKKNVRQMLRETRIEIGLDPDPPQAFRRSGYVRSSQRCAKGQPVDNRFETFYIGDGI